MTNGRPNPCRSRPPEEKATPLLVDTFQDSVDQRVPSPASSDNSPRVGQPSRPYARFVKPILDRIGAGFLLVLLSPLIGAIWLAILRRLGRPAFFIQERVGRNGQTFSMYKFRTMRPDRRTGAREIPFADRRNTHKSEADPRHTPLGRTLRRTGLDELPQLWNVVRGEMSLVGPRPELVAVVSADGLWDHPRHSVRPGITGLWQLSPARNHRLSKNIHHDLNYLEAMSLATDTKILLKTLATPFKSSQRGS